MDKKGFRHYLRERNVPDQEIEQHVSLVEQFERFEQDMPASLFDLSAHDVDECRSGCHTPNVRITRQRKLRKMSMMIIGVQNGQMVDSGKANGWREKRAHKRDKNNDIERCL